MSCRPDRPAIAAMLLISAFLSSGCAEDDEDGPAPWDCQETIPPDGKLDVSVTIDDRYSSVPIIIYRGEWEDGLVELSDILAQERKSYVLGSDQYYSVLALYIQNGDTLAVLDGDDIAVNATSYADATCYKVEDGDVDIRLPE